MWAGAQVQQSHAPMIHHMGGGADLAGVGVMGNAGFLNLDLNGKRFMNEDLPGQQLENQIELQKNRESWQIFDSSWPEQLPYMPQPTAVPATMRLRQRGRRPQEQHYLPQLQEPLSAGSCCGRWPRCEGRHAGRAGGKDLPGRSLPPSRPPLDSIQRYNEAGQGRL